ncbi:hypothetical protein [Pedobacter roseus]|jgi:hypothetical protein|uniref:Uncharacterized protein n=1 Tax=Pedobacter roseus TaxID=336820 RepID=A0A7G9QA05_9SPHI|nr:hypothetical protein [Pedobacter roseus]QNN40180.1 hypothetical protein H9L23_13550 [Pedobacter roseus]
MKQLTKNSTKEELESIRKGDTIKDDTGKQGEVAQIEILTRRQEKQYYYKLKNDGTILVIK